MFWFISNNYADYWVNLLILFYLLLFSPRGAGMNRWIIGVGEEVVDEVGFGDDVGASVFEGAELAFVDKLIHVIFAEGWPAVHLTRAHYIGRAL